MGPLDVVATVAALAYVILAARSNNLCWAFAAVGSAIWAYQSYFVYELVFDGLLQVFYLVMAGVGLYGWTRSAQKEVPPIVRMTGREHLLVIFVSLVGGWALSQFGALVLPSANYPLADAVTTVASVLATFLLVGRRLENWLYFVVIDLAYIGIYTGTQAWLFAGLMVVYTVLAIYGYRAWRLEMKAV